MLKIKSKIKLVGKTYSDTENLLLIGDSYRVIGIQLGMAFDDKDGPWYLLQSLTDGEYLYVHESDDKQYFIEELE